MADEALAQRIERIEALQAIGQLPARYAIAVDSRDLDGLVGLFVDDVRCGRWGDGRPALKSFFDSVLRDFYRSIHQICGHVIDLVDADHATGKVYCRAEHEDSGLWVGMAICYFDTYERRDGMWFFVRRIEQHWYSNDVESRPHAPGFQHWAGHDSQPKLPHAFETWAPFWESSEPDAIAKLTVEP